MMHRYFLKAVMILTILMGWNPLAATAQCDCSAKYYCPLTVKNLGSSVLTNYQVSFTVNTAALVSAGKMQATGADIRVMDASCNVMPYWIETGTMNTTATVIWVNVASIPSSGTTNLNFYYGDASATAASDGNATFLFFDDFNGSSLDATKWNTVSGSGSLTVSGGQVTVSTSGSYYEVQSKNAFPNPYVSEIKVTAATGNWPSLCQSGTSNYSNAAYMCIGYGTTVYAGQSSSNPYGSSLDISAAQGTITGIWSLVKSSTGMVCTWPSGSLTYGTSYANAAATTSQYTAFGGLNGNTGSMTVDFFRARKFDASGTAQTLSGEAINGAGPITGKTTFCGNDTATLGNTTAGGVWTSSNTGVVTINSASGFLQGVNPGTATIVYTIGACAPASTVVTIKQAPGPMLNFVTPLCSSTILNLSDAVTGGTWTSTDPGIANVNSSSGVLTPAAGGVATISYTLSSGCFVAKSLTVNLAPKPITGSPNVCTGLAQSVALSDVIAGGVWSSSNASATVNSTSGLVTGIASGTPFITYKVTAGGCYVTYAITVNVQPAAVSGPANVCVGSSISLSDPSPGGTWSSSNPFQASVPTSTGFVTAVASGTPFISYTLPGGCASTVHLNVNPVPDPTQMIAVPALCIGQSSVFTSPEPGGVWSSGSTSIATATSTGTITGVAGGVAPISYTFTTTGCATTLQTTINTLPNIYAIGGGGKYCVNGAGAHVTLSNSDLNTVYNLYQTGVGTAVATQNGSASAIDFGLISTVGTYTVQATNLANCTSIMSGTAKVDTASLPAQYTVSATGLSSYCSGGTGVHLKLSNSENATNYQVFNGSTAGSSVAGTGSTNLDLGLFTAGTYTVSATNSSTGCKNDMQGSVTVTATALPTGFPVISTSPSTSYCAGTGGVDVSMFNSQSNITYNLYRNGAFVNAVTSSTGGALGLGGKQTVDGTYTVVAVDSTAGCIANMPGSVTVTTNPIPVAQTVSGGGGYCPGDGGKHINLLYSVSGIRYILKDNTGTPIDTLSGSNSGLDFGAVTNPGTYTVSAYDVIGCTNTMSGSATINQFLAPLPYTVLGGGGVCVGDTGTHIKTNGSDATAAYQLYKDGVLNGVPRSAFGGVGVDFGLFTAPGTYTVVAKNSNGCTTPMTNSVKVVVNPLPLQFTVTGGNPYCVGDTNGTTITVGPITENGVTYLLYDPLYLVASKVGTGGPLTFTKVTDLTSLHVTAVTTNGCTKDMIGTVIVKTNPLPVNYSVTGGGAYCAGSAHPFIGDSLSASGVQYTLLESGNPTGTVLGGTGSAISFGRFGAGHYSIMAKNNSTGCVNTGAVKDITENVLPILHTVSGDASFCANDTGRHITLDNSEATVKYQLYNGTTATGSAKPGVTGKLDFGLTNIGGVYTVIAADTATHCTATMLSSATFNVTRVPAAFGVSIVDTSRCAFDLTGLRMNLDSSELDVNYEVFTTTGVPDGFFAGTGLPILLGLHTLPANYMVVATDPATGCSNVMSDTVHLTVIPNTPTSDSVFVFGGADSICSGLPVTFGNVATNGGTAPVYNWKINGADAGTGTTLTYGTPATGDVITATMTSSLPGNQCPFPAHVISKPITLGVTPSATPTVSVTATSAGAVCPGTSVTFTANVGHAGPADHYAWIMNGKPVGSDAATFTVTPTDSIVVFTQLNSSLHCRTTDWVLSNNAPITINEPVLPMLSINALSSTSVNKGGAVTLKAVVENSGSFTYQWSVHGTEIAFATNPTFTYNYELDQENVKVVVTSHNSCGTLSTSKSMLINVRDNTGVKTVSSGGDVKVVPNPNKGTFAVKGTLGVTADEEVTLEVTNMLGQVVFKKTTTVKGGSFNEQVTLGDNVAPGMYLLNLRSDSDNAVFHVVVEQ